MGSAIEVPHKAQREKVRDQVAHFARRGDAPRSRFDDGELAWAFYTDEMRAELAKLEEVAEEARAENARRLEEKAARQRLNTIAQEVRKEWADAEERELQARALAEAERRVAAEEAAEVEE